MVLLIRDLAALKIQGASALVRNLTVVSINRLGQLARMSFEIEEGS